MMYTMRATTLLMGVRLGCCDVGTGAWAAVLEPVEEPRCVLQMRHDLGSPHPWSHIHAHTDMHALAVSLQLSVADSLQTLHVRPSVRACVRACVRKYVHVCARDCLSLPHHTLTRSDCLPSCLAAYRPVCLSACMPAYLFPFLLCRVFLHSQEAYLARMSFSLLCCCCVYREARAESFSWRNRQVDSLFCMCLRRWDNWR